MDCILRTRFVTAVALWSICLALGCSQSSPNESENAPTSASTNPSTDAVSRAAADFLDAVLKGDTQRASARLTPQAMQRIIASGKQFAPPGLETATFRIGQVRTPAEGQAIVLCVLTDTTVADAPRNEEMCCLMRQVDNDWRVSGIAYGTSPDHPWMLFNFETDQSMPIPRQPSTPGLPAVSAQSQPTPDGRPSPPRTAQEPLPPIR